MCDGFLVVVLWPGPFSKLILLVDGALPLTQFILGCNTSNFTMKLIIWCWIWIQKMTGTEALSLCNGQGLLFTWHKVHCMDLSFFHFYSMIVFFLPWITSYYGDDDSIKKYFDWGKTDLWGFMRFLGTTGGPLSKSFVMNFLDITRTLIITIEDLLLSLTTAN